MYSSPIEGLDNQFGSADNYDDEDDKEPISDYPDEFNEPRNRTVHYSPTDSVRDQNLSNKVRKVFNKYEIDNRKFGVNNGYELHFSLFNIIISCFFAIFT